MNNIKIEDHLNLIHYCLHRHGIYNEFKEGIYTYDDYFQECIPALMKAINLYDENKENSFSTFACVWINWKILELGRMIKNENKKDNSNISLSFTNNPENGKSLEFEDILEVNLSSNNNIFDKVYYKIILDNLIKDAKYILSEKEYKIFYMKFILGYSTKQILENNKEFENIYKINKLVYTIRKKLNRYKNNKKIII